MPVEVIQGRNNDPVVQFSIHADNKVGRLNEIVGLLGVHDLHIVAISILDTTDSSIIRLIVDYPDDAQKLFVEHQLSFVRSELIAVEIEHEGDINRVTRALVQAEINIHYTYPFVTRPRGQSALAIRLEDNDLAAEALNAHQLKLLRQEDIAR